MFNIFLRKLIKGNKYLEGKLSVFYFFQADYKLNFWLKNLLQTSLF